MIKLLRLASAIISCLLLPCYLVTIQAQVVALDWAKGIGGTGNDVANAIVADAAGNIYITGSFTQTVDFNRGKEQHLLSAVGLSSGDIFIAKYDNAGSLLWVRQLGNNGADAGLALALDKLGNVYVTGTFTGAVDFDPGLGLAYLVSSGGADVFVLKLTTSGDLVWAKNMGSSGSNESVSSITVDDSGSVYTTGYFVGNVDFDPGPSEFIIHGVGDRNVFVWKLNVNGDLVWAKQMGGPGREAGNAIALDVAGNVYITGEFSSDGDYDPGFGVVRLQATVTNNLNAFVVKLNTLGDLVWAKSMRNGANAIASGKAISIDPSGHVIISGFIRDTVDFDPGIGTFELTSPQNGSSVFVSKWTGAGMFVWAKAIHGKGMLNMTNNTHFLDAAANIYLTGVLRDVADFDPGLRELNLVAESSSGDAFITQWNSSGDLQWAKTSACPGGGQGMGIAVDGSGYIYTCGTFKDSIDVDPTLAVQTLKSHGGNDIFIQKLRPIDCTNTYATVEVAACDTFHGLKQSGQYTWIIPNAAGCDSIITLNLTIKQSKVGNLVYSACDSFHFNDLVYTTSGEYVQSYTNAAGCDSTLYLKITIKRSSWDTLKVYGCSSYTINGQTYTKSGYYPQVFQGNNGCDSVLIFEVMLGFKQVVKETSCTPVSKGGVSYDTTGIYTFKYTSLSGCDSIVEWHLTIPVVDVSVTRYDRTLVASLLRGDYQWMDCVTKTILPGAISYRFSPQRDGRYAVVVTDKGCTDTSKCVVVSGVSSSIKERLVSGGLNVFPNPTSGICVVAGSGIVKKGILSLFNLMGQRLSIYEVEPNGDFQIDLSAYPTGVYILELTQDGQEIRTKVSKN